MNYAPFGYFICMILTMIVILIRAFQLSKKHEDHFILLATIPVGILAHTFII